MGASKEVSGRTASRNFLGQNIGTERTSSGGAIREPHGERNEVAYALVPFRSVPFGDLVGKGWRGQLGYLLGSKYSIS